MRVVTFHTREERTQGLIGMQPIPASTLFVFPDMYAGALFHSRGVLEPFEIHFLDEGGHYMTGAVIQPPQGVIQAPMGTKTIVEAKVGTLKSLGQAALEEILRESS